MNRFILALLSLSLANSAPGAVPGAEELAEVILTMDVSGDNALDQAEYRDGTDDGFDEMDRDRDGKITAVEIDALGGLIGQEQGSVAAAVVPSLIKLMLLAMDQNGDKILSLEEYTKGAQALFTLVDIDKNAVLSRAELTSLPTRLVKAVVK